MSEHTIVSRSKSKEQNHTDIDDDRGSVRSMRSVASRVSSTSAVARREAMVALATATTSQQYELLIQQKQQEQHDLEREQQLREQKIELERRQMELESEKEKLEHTKKQRETQRALSLLAASRDVAIAEATLKAIDKWISEEDGNLEYVEEQDTGNRTNTWIRQHQHSEHSDEAEVSVEKPSDLHLTTQPDIDHPKDCLPTNWNSVRTTKQETCSELKNGCENRTPKLDVRHAKVQYAPEPCSNIVPRCRFTANTPAFQPCLHAVDDQESQPHIANTQNLHMRSMAPGIAPNYIYNAAASTEQANRPTTTPDTTSMGPTMAQMTVQSLSTLLARQSLPKYEPDVFAGDVTLYYPWRNTFKSMLIGADVSPTQELIYMRNFTINEPQRLVDSFRRRLYTNPLSALHDTWAALDDEFGNTAAITQSYIEQIDEAAEFGELDRGKLKDFANVCADVQSQLTHLPGLRSLDYANVLQPITQKIPQSIRLKWEEIVVQYANQHHNKYPGFSSFADLVMSESKLRNHPNLQIGKNANTIEEIRDEHDDDCNDDNDVRVFVTKTRPPTLNAKRCLWDDNPAHLLSNCNNFSDASPNEKYKFVQSMRLCFRCFESGHFSNKCKANIKCGICEADDHRTDFHPHYGRVASTCTRTTNIRSAYTQIQDGQVGSCSWSKAVLVDVYSADRPSMSRRVYALFDDQSNASLISPELVNALGLTGPRERYAMSTCTTQSETRYGRRVSGLIARPVYGKTVEFPSLLECDRIPRTTAEIATPEIAQQFPHLRGVANEIPEKDNEAKVMVIIGRDAPELLKVRAFRNGPRGAPWAHKLSLGWTISGQVGQERAGRTVHITAHKTSVTKEVTTTPTQEFNVPSCNNTYFLCQRAEVSKESNMSNSKLDTLLDDGVMVKTSPNCYKKPQKRSLRLRRDG